MVYTNNFYLELKTHYLTVPYSPEKRRVRVLLPQDYFNEPTKRYPVLYLHDGQNVFHSHEAFAGYSWKIIPLIKSHPEIPPMIVVGIDNSGEYRLDEYAPWKTTFFKDGGLNSFGGLGKNYADWLARELKPFIDRKYRTLPAKENTLLAGSSMGGYITAYIGALYPEIFGNLGVFSSAAWLRADKFSQFIYTHPLDKNAKVYIQTGANESDAGDDDVLPPNQQAQAYIDEALNYQHALLQTGLPVSRIRLRIFANESHHEYYWAKHFSEFLNFIFNEW